LVVGASGQINAGAATDATAVRDFAAGGGGSGSGGILWKDATGVFSIGNKGFSEPGTLVIADGKITPGSGSTLVLAEDGGTAAITIGTSGQVNIGASTKATQSYQLAVGSSTTQAIMLSHTSNTATMEVGTTAQSNTFALKVNDNTIYSVGVNGDFNGGATTIADAANELGWGESGTYLHVDPTNDTLWWVSDNSIAIGAIFNLKHVQGSEADGDYNVIRSTSDDDAGTPNSIVTSEIRMIAADVSTGSVDGAVEIWAADTGTLTEVAHFGVNTAGNTVASIHGATPVVRANHIADPSNSAPAPISTGAETVDRADIDTQIGAVQTNTSNNASAINAILVILENYGLNNTS
jgi:hypothetical protein